MKSCVLKNVKLNVLNLYLATMIMLLTMRCGHSFKRDRDLDYVGIILGEIGSGDSKSDSSESIDIKSIKTNHERNNNENEKAKRDVKEAIETLKKYAQWKGKWDFIKSSKQVIIEAKELANKESYIPLVLEYKESATSATCGKLTSVGVEIILNAIKSFEDHDEISAEISRQMNNKYGKFWHVLITDGNHYAHNLYYDSYILVHVGDLAINLFQLSSLKSFDAIINARRNVKSIKEARVQIKAMPSSMSNVVIESAIEAVNEGDDLYEIASTITEKVSKKFGSNNYWQAIVGGKKEKSFSFEVNHDLLIQFTLDDIEITLFNSTKRTARDMIIQARTVSSESDSIRSNMDPIMKREIVEIALEGLNLYDDQTAIADHLIDALNRKYGKSWFAIISFGPSDFGLDKSTMEKIVKGEDGPIITFTIGDVRFHIYKLFRETSEEQIINQARKSVPRIFNNQMSNTKKSEALMVAVEAVRTSYYLLSIASKIQDHFENKYSSQWQVIVNLRNNDVSANLRYPPRSFLHFGIGEIVIRIFKSSSSSSSSTSANKLCEISSSTLSPTTLSTTSTSPTTHTLKQISQEEAINKSKDAKPKIIAINDLDQLSTHAMDITIKAFGKNKDFKGIASDVRKNFAENFELFSHFIYGFSWLPDLYWNCLVGFKDEFSIGQFLISQQRHLILEVGNIEVIIFQIGGFQCDEMLNYSKGSKVIKRQHWISGADITSEMYKEAQKITVEAMLTSKTCISLTESITLKMSQEWPSLKPIASVGVTNSFQYSCENNLMKFYIGYLNFRICL